MAKTFTSRHARLSAVVTGRGKVVGAIEAHERNVLAITRSIHRLAGERNQLQKRLREITDELRFKRRELRAVLQRDSSITEESAVLDVAGRSDAIDAHAHRLEGK